jgi:hypothetical protein
MTKEEEPRWHQDEDDFLKRLERQCNTYYEHHSKDHLYYTKLSSKFNVPILIVSAINALTAVGLNSFIRQEYVSVLNAVLSAGTGVLGSIQLYLKINEKITNSLRASILMRRLALKISKELSIDMKHRETFGLAFMNDCFAEFNTALEQGNPIEKNLHNHLAFTQLPKKEKYSIMGAAANFMNGSPRRESIESSLRSRENLTRLEEPRAKMIWGLVEKARTIENSPLGSQSPSRQNESSPGGTTPEEQDVEIVARDS